MCEIDFDSGDPAEVWSESLVRARKDHLCHMCGGTIERGQLYQKHFSVFDRSPNHERRCLPCETITCAFQREHKIRYTPDGMKELIKECLQEGSYWDDDDNRVPIDDNALRWKYALIEMDARRDRRKAAA